MYLLSQSLGSALWCLGGEKRLLQLEFGENSSKVRGEPVNMP